MRADLAIIADLVNPGARVLDLGCGEGDLLARLITDKAVNGYGLEIDADNITTCIRKGVNVIEQDLDAGLDNFADDSFDMVVMTETLQSVKAPVQMLKDMLRIGSGVHRHLSQLRSLALPNCYLATRGRMPVSEHLPHSWYDTPNIHLCTFLDFERLCQAEGFNIIERFVVDAEHANRPLINRFPNFFGTFAFYRLGRPGS